MARPICDPPLNKSQQIYLNSIVAEEKHKHRKRKPTPESEHIYRDLGKVLYALNDVKHAVEQLRGQFHPADNEADTATQ